MRERTSPLDERAGFARRRRGLHAPIPSAARAAWRPVLVGLLAGCLVQLASAQSRRQWIPVLSDDFVKDGARVLDAFKPVAEAARESVATLAVNGNRVELGTLVDTNGFLVTKASELKPGKLTVTLTDGREFAGKVVATDEDNDVASVKITAPGLKPIAWAAGDTTVGQWVATPGQGTTPEAVGIVSVPPRKILPKRALIGVMLDTNDTPARIAEVTPGFGADKAGLKPGDAILAVNGEAVTNREGLINKLREFPAGRTVKLRVKRGDETFDATVGMTAETTVMAADLSRMGLGGFGRGGRRGFGFGFDRQDMMNRMGSEVSQRATEFDLAIQHDTVLEPWQCGGPLVNLDGKAVGVNIARAGRVASYALPASLVQRIVQELKAKADRATRS